MKTLNENQLNMAFMFEVKDPELTEQFKQLDSVHNLNYDSMAIRCAGHKAARLAFVLGAKYAQNKLAESCSEYESVLKAFDAWYCESSHMCELTDRVNAGGSDGLEAQKQLGLLSNLLNASINCNSQKANS